MTRIFTVKEQHGSILLSFIIMLPFLILICSLYMGLTVSSLRLANNDQMQSHAQLATDAGIDDALRQLNLSGSWTGSGSEIELQPLTNNVRTTFQTAVASPSDDQKVVTSTGRSYRGSSTAAHATITINVTLRPVVSGEYSVVGGVGGLIMDNHAKILGGDVHINGKINMQNHAQIGQSISPVNLTVAHQSCPVTPDATYPRICLPADNAGEPISMNGDAHIYGDVRANNQTAHPAITDPGVTASSGVAAQPLLAHDRAAMTTTINNADASDSPDAMTGSAASCTSNTTKSWPANLKINGDVEISKKCKLTVNGDVWITGSLTVDNSQTEMIVANSLGTTRPVIMVDGVTAKFANSSILRSNSNGTGFMIITYKSAAACTTEVPGCSNINGVDLANSQNDLTIELDNGAAGANTIFYSRWTKVAVRNSGSIGALIGQTIDLSNSGTITFGTSAGTGTSFWIIDSYRRVF